MKCGHCGLIMNVVDLPHYNNWPTQNEARRRLIAEEDEWHQFRCKHCGWYDVIPTPLCYKEELG